MDKQSSRIILHRPRAIVTTLLTVLLLTSGAWSTAGEPPDNDTPSLERLLAAIQQRVDTTSTVQCTFVQERNLSIFARPIIFTGKMELSRPDKLRWENLTPIPSVLIFSGDKGLRCNDDAPPVHFDLEKDQVMKMVAEQIWTWADGKYARLQDKYTITLRNEREIMLVPKDSKFSDVITSVTVRFDRQSLQPETIDIREDKGDSTTIRFADYQLNIPLDERLFTTCYP